MPWRKLKIKNYVRAIYAYGGAHGNIVPGRNGATEGSS